MGSHARWRPVIRTSVRLARSRTLRVAFPAASDASSCGRERPEAAESIWPSTTSDLVCYTKHRQHLLYIDMSDIGLYGTVQRRLAPVVDLDLRTRSYACQVKDRPEREVTVVQRQVHGRVLHRVWSAITTVLPWKSSVACTARVSARSRTASGGLSSPCGAAGLGMVAGLTALRGEGQVTRLQGARDELRFERGRGCPWTSREK